MNTAIYARVSTTDQNCALQLSELREHCARRGWTVAAEYVDTGWSGTKARRPELDRLMADARSRRIDCICVWKLDRFGRSVLNLSQAITELSSLGVRFVAISQGLDTDESNPSARLLLHILASVAEFEREMIVERVNAGIKAAKNRGVRFGRPKKIFNRGKVVEMRQGGMSWSAIAAKLDIGIGTAVRAYQTHGPGANANG